MPSRDSPDPQSQLRFECLSPPSAFPPFVSALVYLRFSFSVHALSFPSACLTPGPNTGGHGNTSPPLRSFESLIFCDTSFCICTVHAHPRIPFPIIITFWMVVHYVVTAIRSVRPASSTRFFRWLRRKRTKKCRHQLSENQRRGRRLLFQFVGRS